MMFYMLKCFKKYQCTLEESGGTSSFLQTGKVKHCTADISNTDLFWMPEVKLPKPDFCACRTLTAVTDFKQRCRSEDVKYTKQPQRCLNLGTKIKVCSSDCYCQTEEKHH